LTGKKEKTHASALRMRKGRKHYLSSARGEKQRKQNPANGEVGWMPVARRLRQVGVIS